MQAHDPMRRHHRILRSEYERRDDPNEKYPWAVQHLSMDAYEYAQIYTSSVELQDVVNRGIRTVGPAFDYLVEDIFYTLYKRNPPLRPEDNLDPIGLLNRSVLESLRDSKAFRQLSFFTRHVVHNAVIGTVSLANQLLYEFENQQASGIPQPWNSGDPGDDGDGDLQQSIAAAIQQMISSATSAQQDLERLQSELDYLERLNRKNPNTSFAQKIEQLRQQIEEQMSQLSGTIEKLKDLGASEQVQKAADKSSSVAKDTVSQLDDAIRSWGMERGHIQRRPIPDQVKMIEEFNRSELFHKLANLIGKFRDLARGKIFRTDVEGYGSLVGIEYGDQLFRATPTEMLYAEDPVFERDFLTRFYERRLMQYKYRAKDFTQRGAVVVCVDQSGSMSHNRKSEYASALALGLAEIALRKRRPYICIIFSSHQDPLVEIEIDPGNPDPRRLLDIAETTIGGGTDFETPLDRAMQLIRREPRFHDADVLMITDGQASVRLDWQQRFLQQKKDLKVHLYSLLVDVGQSSHQTLGPLSDEVFLVTEINQEIADKIYGLVSDDHKTK